MFEFFLLQKLESNLNMIYATDQQAAPLGWILMTALLTFPSCPFWTLRNLQSSAEIVLLCICDLWTEQMD